MEIKRIRKSEVKQFKDEWRLADKELGFDWNKKEYVFGVLDGKDIVGYIHISINGGVGYLKDIIIKKSFRGKGMGIGLMEFFEGFCREKGCHKLTLSTSERHKAALKLYKKAGFKVESKMKNDRYKVVWYNLCKFL